MVGIPCDLRTSSETAAVEEEEVRRLLTAGVGASLPSLLTQVHYTMVCLVHCETSSGVMNSPEKVYFLSHNHHQLRASPPHPHHLTTV